MYSLIVEDLTTKVILFLKKPTITVLFFVIIG